jgi:hypothetical protein
MTSDLALLDAALDAGRVVDDYLRSVIGLGDGRWGGIDDRKPSWYQKVLGRATWTKEHQLARMYGGAYGPEQLRKAAKASQELVDAVAALGTATDPSVVAVHAELRDLGVDRLPTDLRDPDVTATSPSLRDAHLTLTRAIGRMNEARTKVLLAQMRANRPADSGD